MANVTFNIPITPTSFAGYQQIPIVTGQAPNALSISDNGGFNATFYGSFNYYSFGPSGLLGMRADIRNIDGVVTGYTLSHNNLLSYTVTNINSTANAMAYWSALSPYSLFEYTLGGNDVVTGTTGADDITGYAGNDDISGGDGNDVLYGDLGDDTINGGTGNDILYGSYGNDTLVVDSINDIAYGGDGIDTLVVNFGPGTYTFQSDLENFLFENSNDVNVIGNASNNIISGNSGNNILSGGGGNDSLDGGAGADTAKYSGVSSGYRLSYNAGVISVQDIDAANGNEGTDTLRQIETMQFFDMNIGLVNGLEYIASNTDLINLFGTNADAGISHYLQGGVHQGRTANFNGLKYIASNADLINVFGTNADAGISH